MCVFCCCSSEKGKHWKSDEFDIVAFHTLMHTPAGWGCQQEALQWLYANQRDLKPKTIKELKRYSNDPKNAVLLRDAGIIE